MSSKEFDQGRLEGSRVEGEGTVLEFYREVHGPELGQPSELLVRLQARERLVVVALGTVQFREEHGRLVVMSWCGETREKGTNLPSCPGSLSAAFWNEGQKRRETIVRWIGMSWRSVCELALLRFERRVED